MSVRQSLLLRIARATARDEKGTVAIIFALSIFVLFLITGLAIDVGRVMHAENTIASATDAASLAAAKEMLSANLTDDQVEAYAKAYFEANMKGHGASYADVRNVTVTVDRANSTVAINVDSSVPTIFANLVGIGTFDVPKGSTAVFSNKDIEVSLQLDLTGSMCQPCSKIAALKDAVAGTGGLLDILLPDSGTTNSVRIGLAPFTEGVNAGIYAAAVTGGTATKDGCTYERRNPTLQATDDAPTGGAALKSKKDLPSADPCPAGATVSALSNDKAKMRATINSWGTYNGTAGHLGTAWAWYLLSPKWASIWGGTAPAPYNDGKTQKYAILMTDGIYNTAGGKNIGGDYGPTATQSQAYAQAQCAAMKLEGITIYTIGFKAPTGAKDNLIKCATDSSKFFDAQDADALKAAFKAIAEQINNLRLAS
ncbi:MAG: hypothetical protein JSS20_05605 [Proteobacteria bacterium]|nr:hypothetical protein [Pseudomonadota bacterium]